MKTIKVSAEMHKRLQKDQKEFTEKIGYRFSMNDTIRELYKIIRAYKETQK